MSDRPPIERDAQPYTPLFCEENVWQLARRMSEGEDVSEPQWVLLFSNPARKFVMLQQRRAGEAGYVVWDYHLVLQVGPLIYDLDSTLPFPFPAFDYLRMSFPAAAALPEAYRAGVRVIPAAAFLARFRSDRSHMVGFLEAEAFPPWPAILPAGPEAIDLSAYWDLERELPDGSEVMTVEELRHRGMPG